MDIRSYGRNQFAFYNGIKQRFCNFCKTLFNREVKNSPVDNKMYNVKIKIQDNRKYGPEHNDKVISYCKIEHYNGLDKNTVLYLFKDYLDVILDINKNVVEPTRENISKLNLYNNELNIFPSVLKYYKDRYLKYKECVDKLDDVNLQKFTIDLSKCYRFCVDDIVSHNLNKNTTETITVERY